MDPRTVSAYTVKTQGYFVWQNSCPLVRFRNHRAYIKAMQLASKKQGIPMQTLSGHTSLDVSSVTDGGIVSSADSASVFTRTQKSKINIGW